MNLLIDTHAVIWFIADNPKLPKSTKQIIEDSNNTCYISIASYWELAIKHTLGRLELSSDLENIFQIIEETGFQILPITTSHILRNSSLPLHHQDPFDRIIIAQAIEEQLTIVGKDHEFNNYAIKLIWN